MIPFEFICCTSRSINSFLTGDVPMSVLLICDLASVVIDCSFRTLLHVAMFVVSFLLLLAVVGHSACER